MITQPRDYDHFPFSEKRATGRDKEYAVSRVETRRASGWDAACLKKRPRTLIENVLPGHLRGGRAFNRLSTGCQQGYQQKCDCKNGAAIGDTKEKQVKYRQN